MVGGWSLGVTKYLASRGFLVAVETTGICGRDTLFRRPHDSEIGDPTKRDLVATHPLALRMRFGLRKRQFIVGFLEQNPFNSSQPIPHGSTRSNSGFARINREVIARASSLPSPTCATSKDKRLCQGIFA